jgi:hypothetical protein
VLKVPTEAFLRLTSKVCADVVADMPSGPGGPITMALMVKVAVNDLPPSVKEVVPLAVSAPVSCDVAVPFN